MNFGKGGEIQFLDFIAAFAESEKSSAPYVGGIFKHKQTLFHIAFGIVVGNEFAVAGTAFTVINDHFHIGPFVGDFIPALIYLFKNSAGTVFRGILSLGRLNDKK